MKSRGEKISKLMEQARSANIQIIEIPGRKTDHKKKVGNKDNFSKLRDTSFKIERVY